MEFCNAEDQLGKHRFIDQARRQPMTPALILAPLSGGARDEIVLGGAFAAAKPFGAHVEALFVNPDPVDAMPYYGEGMSSAVVQEIIDVSREAAGKASQLARKTLTVAASAAGAAVLSEPGRSEGISASFVEVQGNFADQVAVAARLSDLVVFGPLKEADRPGLAEAFESTLIDSGKPVLLTSQQMIPSFGEKIAIAWNGSLAAAHAVSAALPFLSKATAIEILTVGRANAEPIDASDLERYLGLHGLVARVRKVDGGGRPISDVLLEAAAAGGSGMLVAGGYGHNRLREMFVTGITRRVAARADIPCFLVH